VKDKMSDPLVLYRYVIDDVIANMKDEFATEGIDESVLQTLKNTWEQHLTYHYTPYNMPNFMANNSNPPNANMYLNRGYTPVPTNLSPNLINHQNNYGMQNPSHLNPNSSNASLSLDDQKRRPRNNTPSGGPVAINRNAKGRGAIAPHPQSINVIATQHPGGTPQPRVTLEEWSNQLKIAAPVPSPYDPRLRNTNNTAGRGTGTGTGTGTGVKKEIQQMDGPGDDDDEEEDEEEEEDDDDDENDETEDGEDDEEEDDKKKVKKEEPLDDDGDLNDPTLDVSDGEDFDEKTPNIMLCLYDKVKKIKAKRRLTLKYGIMNVKGRDYVFHTANGDLLF